MADDTTQFARSDGESRIGGISVRAILAVLLVATACAIALAAAAEAFRDKLEIKVPEPVATLAGIAVGFYLGQKPQPKT